MRVCVYIYVYIYYIYVYIYIYIYMYVYVLISIYIYRPLPPQRDPRRPPAGITLPRTCTITQPTVRTAHYSS